MSKLNFYYYFYLIINTKKQESIFIFQNLN